MTRASKLLEKTRLQFSEASPWYASELRSAVEIEADGLIHPKHFDGGFNGKLYKKAIATIKKELISNKEVVAAATEFLSDSGETSISPASFKRMGGREIFQTILPDIIKKNYPQWL